MIELIWAFISAFISVSAEALIKLVLMGLGIIVLGIIAGCLSNYYRRRIEEDEDKS